VAADQNEFTQELQSLSTLLLQHTSSIASIKAMVVGDVQRLALDMSSRLAKLEAAAAAVKPNEMSGVVASDADLEAAHGPAVKATEAAARSETIVGQCTVRLAAVEELQVQWQTKGSHLEEQMEQLVGRLDAMQASAEMRPPICAPELCLASASPKRVRPGAVLGEKVDMIDWFLFAQEGLQTPSDAASMSRHSMESLAEPGCVAGGVLEHQQPQQLVQQP
jgi:hypothetical protein